MTDPSDTRRQVIDKRVPRDFTDDEMTVAEALHALTWTSPKPEYGPEWHHQFQWWQCVLAAREAVAALSGRSAR